MVAVKPSPGSATGWNSAVIRLVQTNRSSGTASSTQPRLGVDCPSTCITLSNRPPGLSSTTISDREWGLGMNQCTICAGVVHAA